MSDLIITEARTDDDAVAALRRAVARAERGQATAGEVADAFYDAPAWARQGCLATAGPWLTRATARFAVAELAGLGLLPARFAPCARPTSAADLPPSDRECLDALIGAATAARHGAF